MDTRQILSDLHVELNETIKTEDRIRTAIATLESLNGSPRFEASAAAKTLQPTAKRRTMSPEARKHMADAQQKRWSTKKTRVTKAAAKEKVPLTT